MPDNLPLYESAWTGPEISRTPEKWILELSGAEIEDLDRAVTATETQNIVGITKKDTPLPVLAEL